MKNEVYLRLLCALFYKQKGLQGGNFQNFSEKNVSIVIDVLDFIVPNCSETLKSQTERM